MGSEIMRTYIDRGIRALDRMEETSRRGNEISMETLMRLIRENEDTEYGKKYGFRQIRSYADYAARVPLSGYEDYEPYIDRMLFLGRKNLITAEDVVYFARTSGTSGASKMIPCTQSFLDILFDTVFLRAFALCEKSCREKTGEGMPDCKGINLMESGIRYTRFGAAAGAISETLNVPEDTRFYNALPEELIYPVVDFDRRHLKMLFALKERHLSFLMSTFSSTLYDMITYLRHAWRVLCDDLEAGRINADIQVEPKLRARLEEKLTPDPERAAEVRRIMAEHEQGAFIPLLWPDLKLAATVGTAAFAPFISKLRQSLGPAVAVDHLGYVCSEAAVAAALKEDDPEYMLLPFGGFYEFIPVEEGAGDTPLLMDQLEIGKEYELVITNLSGFYRYRLGDVVRVTGYHNECPMLVFAYRKNQLISMYGEKVSETVLHTAVNAMAEETGLTALEFSVYADVESEPFGTMILFCNSSVSSSVLWG